MNLIKSIVSSVALLTMTMGVVYAGPYNNELSKCLVDSTSKKDRTNLVKWVFSAASLNPAVSSIANVSPQDLDKANAQTAKLLMRLLTESCKSETQNALKFEGPVTLQASFQVLGQVAGRELFNSPEVSKAMAGLAKHLDAEKLKGVLGKE